MVFEKGSIPRERKGFMEWFNDRTNWREEQDYDDPTQTSESLSNWFFEMIDTFPPMNGPYSDPELDDEHITGYCIGKDSIYLDFRWSVAQKAYQTVTKLTKKHDLGFFDVSGDNRYIMIPSNGRFEFIDKQEQDQESNDQAIVIITRKRPWWKFWIKNEEKRMQNLA